MGNKELEELRKLSDKKLLEKHREMRINLLMTSKNMLNPKFPPQKRGSIRRTIARINTIVGERKLRGRTKEEKRLK